jgi:hypothetical protein
MSERRYICDIVEKEEEEERERERKGKVVLCLFYPEQRFLATIIMCACVVYLYLYRLIVMAAKGDFRFFFFHIISAHKNYKPALYKN